MALSQEALWFRDKFGSQFSPRQLLKEEVKHFFEDLAELIHEKVAKALPEEFFDLDANARRYAQTKKIKVEDAKQRIIERAEILLQTYSVPAAGVEMSGEIDEDIEASADVKPKTKKNAAPRKVLIADRPLYEAILKVRETTKRNPGPHSGREHLPDYSLGWNSVLQNLRARGETIVGFADRMEKADLAQGKLPALTAREIFDSCAESIRERQCLPTQVKGYSAMMVNACLRDKKVEGLSEFTDAAACPPKNLAAFAAAAGLAILEGKHLVFDIPVDAPKHRMSG